ncbi:MAG: hypothetical protein AAGH87_06920 [Pseudomonadota bacterium]
MIEHEKVEWIRVIWQGPPNDLKRVLMVKTSIELDCLHPDWTEKERQSVEAAVTQYFEDHKDAYDSVTILPKAWPSH